MSLCRVTMTFVAEFDSDNPEVDLAQLEEEGALDLIRMCYDREYDTNVDVHTEQGL